MVKGRKTDFTKVADGDEVVVSGKIFSNLSNKVQVRINGKCF